MERKKARYRFNPGARHPAFDQREWGSYEKVMNEIRDRFDEYFFAKHSHQLKKLGCGIVSVVYALEMLEKCLGYAESTYESGEDDKENSNKIEFIDVDLKPGEDGYEMWKKFVKSFDENFTFNVYKSILQWKKEVKIVDKKVTLQEVRVALLHVLHKKMQS